MVLGTPLRGEGQLISPGRLSKAHGELEGMGNCTQCHQLRIAGADRTRCLQCHASLSRRVEAGDGYHGRLDEKDCGTCHKEHLGEDFSLIRMDTDTFPHPATGYTLKGAHAKVGCRNCHTPEFVSDPQLRQELAATGGLARSYLGLNPQCKSCHESDDPHQNQFAGRDCSGCHTELEWEGAMAFDHTKTSYPLDGQHSDVECTSCHVADQLGGEVGSIRYAPVDTSDCSSCHDDPHKNQMPGPCNGCHLTSGWHRVNRSTVESTFDHESTGFALVGAHTRAECQACHSTTLGTNEQVTLHFSGRPAGRSYPIPEHENCTSCHLDSHEGDFGDRSCDLCHGPDSWIPPDFDRAQHQMELRFELSGAHTVTPCADCHETEVEGGRRLVFRFEDPGSCAVCHQSDDPHEDAFQTPGCDLCHQTAGFEMDRFDHGFLEEAGWTGSCRTCHEEDGPHGMQFGTRDCRECHGTDAYAIPDFDHMNTRFPLEGAHANVSCGECHLEMEGPGGMNMIRYRPLDPACTACHGGTA